MPLLAETVVAEIPKWLAPSAFGAVMVFATWLAKGRFDRYDAAAEKIEKIDTHAEEIKILRSRTLEHAEHLSNHGARLQNLERRQR